MHCFFGLFWLNTLPEILGILVDDFLDFLLVLKQLSCKTLENESRGDRTWLATSHFGRFLNGRKARFHLGNSVSYMADMALAKVGRLDDQKATTCWGRGWSRMQTTRTGPRRCEDVGHFILCMRSSDRIWKLWRERFTLKSGLPDAQGLLCTICELSMVGWCILVEIIHPVAPAFCLKGFVGAWWFQFWNTPTCRPKKQDRWLL